MTTYNTGNPLGSAAAKDLYDNAQNLDNALNDNEQVIWIDRFGRERRTWFGLESMVAEAAAKYGFTILSGQTFATGATVNVNDILLDESTGEYFQWTGSFPEGGLIVPPGSTPVTSGGEGPGAWLSVGNAALRSMLSGADGRKYIGKVPTIAALRSIEPTANKQWIDVEKYWEDSLPPQGTYWHDASDTTSEDNGGTIIVTVGGKRWKFIGQPTVETYGAYGRCE
ncbi:hypothetical protein ACISAP_13520 [Citrobacter amalonaticus]|uniref:tail fiber/spike domain-containing protein n=1 Tax=Citrobacter amalonaticus TaxID=35703 RepID=UPI0039E73CFD